MTSFDILFTIECRAAISGGAVHVNSHGITLTSVTLVWVNQSQFVQNTAGVDRMLAMTNDPTAVESMDGGAWTLDGGVNIFVNNTFDGNSAYGNGGAISYKYYCFTGTLPCSALPLALPCASLPVPSCLLCPTSHSPTLHCTVSPILPCPALPCPARPASALPCPASNTHFSLLVITSSALLHFSVGHRNCQNAALCVFTGGNLRWAYLDQDAADQSKNCSTLSHSSNSYVRNSAKLAGGVLFSSDISSSRLNCKP